MPESKARFDFKDARILVTGGSNGIGLATASAFHAAGASVTITGTAKDPSSYDADLSSFAYRQMELEDNESVSGVAQSLDALDVLVNNAGARRPGGGNEWEPDVFEQAVRINLTSGYRLTQACLPLLEKSALPGGAAIVGIASLTSIFGHPMVPGYGAAKTGLTGLTRAMAVTWADKKIRANAVAAGMVNTRMTSMVQEIPEMNDPILARTPMKRWAQPDEIADGVLFLASDQARFITGQTLVIDGGFSSLG
jgi:NAD(P)-dependent dehydrogenase (short-subunit alcohol dehydrogenase family)